MAKSTTTKKSAKQSKDLKATKPVVVEEVQLPVESSSGEEESEDEGVDEAGMEKLLEALGEDGLDEFDQARLQALTADEEDDSDDDAEENEDAGGESGAEDAAQDEESENEDIDVADDESDDEDLIALDEVDDLLDPDTVPRQKVKIDNKVRRFISSF